MGKYIIRNEEDVTYFIESHPFLVNLLEDAFTRIQALFGGSKLFLELIDDPDFTGNSHLTLFISTKIEANEALKRLDHLKKNWWFKVIPTLQPVERGLLNLSLEFYSN